MKKIVSWLATPLIFLVALLIALTMTAPKAAALEPGSDPDNPIQVDRRSQLPNGAVETGRYQKPGYCGYYSTWEHRIPGKDEVNHEEYRYQREVPAQAEKSHNEWSIEKRTRDEIPAQAEESHQEYKYQREVQDTKTEEQWEKHVKGTKEKKNSRGEWVPDGQFGWQDYPGAGPVWADGGSGPHHSVWVEGNRRYTSTEFKYVKTGVTREVPNGSHTETSDWVTSQPTGDGWVKIDERKVIDKEAVPASYGEWSEWTVTESGLKTEPTAPTNTDTTQYRVTGPVKVVDEPATEGYTEYYVFPDSTSKVESEASWVDVYHTPDDSWMMFDQRTIVDEPAVKAKVVYYLAKDDHTLCPVTTPKPSPPSSLPPSVPPTTPPAKPSATPTPEKPTKPAKPPVKRETPKAPVKKTPPVAAPTPTPELAHTGGPSENVLDIALGLMVLGSAVLAIGRLRRK